MSDLLKTITDLSHEFGTPDFVKGGGGNTSAKTPDTLWIKPSGATLAGMTPEKFVEMDRKKLAQLYNVDVPVDSLAREALVKDMMMAAVKSGQSDRPSVEAPLHDILAGNFIVHTHATLVNGMTCAKNAAAVCAHLFPDALWVPYIDPGFTLCMDVRRRVRGQRLIILENHGIFVAGDTANEIRETYRRVLDILREEYQTAGISTELETLPNSNVPEPVTPDHIVCGKNPKLGPAMAEDCALIRQLAAAFGGMKLLDARARKFIEEREGEADRRKPAS
jgi:rhamnose utilization protein RhaD (predicted bifunctional aldolase and dehydrogenase)